MTQYLLGQGKVYIAARDAAGKPKALRWLGDVSAAKVGLKVTKADQKESYSGQRSTVKSIVVGKEATLDLTLQEVSKDNLSLALSGKSTSLPSGSVTAEVLPADIVSGDRVSLKYPKVSTVVITDSATTPVTLDPAKYDVDADFGAITFKDITSVTQPLKVAYTHAALESVSMFSAQQSDVFIRYEGINLAEGGTPIVVELYKVNPEPLKDLALITDKFADMTISSAVLIDTNKPADGELGQFGRIIQVAQI